MSFVDDVKNIVNKVSVGAKKTIDSTKLEFKIKSYNKDVNYNLNQIGRLVYEHKINLTELDSELITNYCNEIYNTKDILNNLQKRLDNMKNKENNVEKQSIIKTTFDQKENKKYFTLDRKADDFKITRTPEGIKILKFCFICNTGNATNSTECENCGNSFGENK